jgi:transposase
MNNNTIYVGMDVHKESFSLCAFTIEEDKGKYHQKTDPDFKKVLKYLEFLRTIYGDDAKFVCGYEAGCLGYTLYHQLTSHDVDCKILAPTTMLEQRSRKRIKTDKRDAEIIARCLAQHNYSPVHIPTAKDEETKEFLRMRDDHKLALKKVKQQILAFCLRHNYRYDGNSHWTAAHLKWLKALNPEALYKEILDEYLLTYQTLSDKLERLDKRIEELASQNEYKEAVNKLCCFIGVKTHTALSVVVEVGDFKRFASAENFASYLGLVPGEHTSDSSQTRLGITKAGNRHVRLLLTEASQCYARGQVGFKWT